MKNKTLNSIVVVIALIVSLLNLFGNIKHSFYFDINDLPTGEFLFSSMSQDTNKTIKIYKVAVLEYGVGIRAELVETKDNEEIVKNIYWQTNQDNVTISWINDRTVQINNEIIDLYSTPFDCRRKIEIPEVTAKFKGLI